MKIRNIYSFFFLLLSSYLSVGEDISPRNTVSSVQSKNFFYVVGGSKCLDFSLCLRNSYHHVCSDACFTLNYPEKPSLLADLLGGEKKWQYPKPAERPVSLTPFCIQGCSRCLSAQAEQCWLLPMWCSDENAVVQPVALVWGCIRSYQHVGVYLLSSWKEDCFAQTDKGFVRDFLDFL